MSSPRRSKSAGPKAPPKRGRSARQDWRAGRPRAELVRAWVAGALVVALSIVGVVILGRGFIWTDDSTPIPIPTAPDQTVPTGDVTPPPSEIPAPSEIPVPAEGSGASSTVPPTP